MSNFNQGIPGPATLINSSSTLLYGNAASANALSVQQLGAGPVATFRTTTGATALFVNAAGNVGVGTTNPQGLLEVGNVGTGSDPTYTGSIRICADPGSSLNANGGLEFKPTTFSSGYGWRLTSADWTGGNTPLVFQARAASATWSNVMTILNNGRVGVGTTNPGGPLQVSNAAGTTIFTVGATNIVSNTQIATGGNGTLILGNLPLSKDPGALYDPTYDDSAQFSVQSFTGIGALGVGALRIGVSSNTSVNAQGYSYLQTVNKFVGLPPLSLNPRGGNVGIGTANPGYLLDAGASVSIPLSGGETIRSKGPLIIGNGSNDNYRFISALDSSITATNTRFISFGKAASSYNSAEILYYHAGDASTSNYLGLGMYGINAPLYVAATGRVGIGITNPVAGLHCFSTTNASLLTGGTPGSGVVIGSDLDYGRFPGEYSPVLHFRQSYFTAGSGSISTGGIAGYKTVANGSFGGGLAFLYCGNGATTLAQGMTLTHAGRVGIGTTSPATVLSVQGGAASGRTDMGGDTIEIGAGRTADGVAFIDFHTADGTYSDYALRITRFGGANNTTNILHRGTGEVSYINVEAADHAWYTSNAEKMRLTTAGRLGIGTASPGYPLHVNGAVNLSTTFRYFNNGTVLTQVTSTCSPSIYASNDIAAGASIVAVSDRRAKILEGPPSEPYLNLVDKVQVRQFSWIDKVEKDPRKKIGFFAQEVEKVLPDAVGKTTGVVPTIYREANAFTESTITVTNHGLTTEKKLEVVDLENGKTKVDIVKVIDADNLEVKFEKPVKDKLFVVGPEVDDSRLLNHDYLMAVGFGGLKELHALVKTQAQTIESLEARLAALEARLGPA